MYFPFECKVCRKDKWSIRYDSENKVHVIQCANCGEVEILEDIFGNRRGNKNVSKTEYKKKLNTESKRLVESPAAEVIRPSSEN